MSMASNGGGKPQLSSGGVDDEPSSLEKLLAAARPFLRGGDHEVGDEALVSVLRGAGAGECYHKHGTFLAHLLDTYRILRLWGAAPESAVARCGLFHSSYSNSYVNLAIFHPDTGRDRLIHDNLIFHYTDAELREHLAAAQATLLKQALLLQDNATELGRVRNTTSSEPDCYSWRRKLRSLVPADGVVAKHIRTGEPVLLSRRVLAVFVLITIADFSDQYTDYQDKLFRTTTDASSSAATTGRRCGRARASRGSGSAPCQGSPRSTTSWPPTTKSTNLLNSNSQRTTPMVGELMIPPVFDGCTKVLDAGDQKAARDLYWQAICSDDDDNEKKMVEALLRESISKNPFVGEPYLVLAQVLLNAGRYDEAHTQAEQGLKLLLQWGSSWDKRMSWEGWVSWARVMRDKAKLRQWPTSKWGIINLGLVDGVVNTNAP
ncbi:hypothetical protein EJB05_19118, partial [Eragrostis curvula]